MNTQKRKTEPERKSGTVVEIKRACLNMEAGYVKDFQVEDGTFLRLVGASIRKLNIITGRKYMTSFRDSTLTVKRES
ncbi:MAG: hypothetical protein LBL57_04075 [Tannerella sp.]|jgi:3-deoxy-D-manno-octulosonate 8-phosphate phosphatase KdsC-like HAD superfamily phosphatase|nr:hypothetical protein [Tannerella sp.]